MLKNINKCIWIFPSPKIVYPIFILFGMSVIYIMDVTIVHPQLRQTILGNSRFTLQHIMYIFFFCGLGGFYIRWRSAVKENHLIQEHSSLGLYNDSLENYVQENELDNQDCFLPYLLSIYSSALKSLDSDNQVLHILDRNIEMYIQKVDLRYNFLRYLVWLIPTLGFIGTILGIAMAMNQLSPESSSLSEVVKSLAFAFNTTLVALSLSSILVFLLYMVQGIEERTVIDVGLYVHRIISGHKTPDVYSPKKMEFSTIVRKIIWISSTLIIISIATAIYIIVEPLEKTHISITNNKSIEEPLKDIWKEQITGMEFLHIESSNYIMGNTFPIDEGDIDEKPREILIRDSWVCRTEVTQKQWKIIMGGENPASELGDNLPVNRVNWDDVHNFNSRLNNKYAEAYDAGKIQTKISFRLPREDEWEYACRSGGKKVRFGDGSNVAKANNINFDSKKDCINLDCVHDEPVGRLTPVGTYGFNEMRFADMSGSVSEWVEYKENIEDDSHKYNKQELIRGGSFRSSANQVRCSNRVWYDSWRRSKLIGFRLALDISK